MHSLCATLPLIFVSFDFQTSHQMPIFQFYTSLLSNVTHNVHKLKKGFSGSYLIYGCFGFANEGQLNILSFMYGPQLKGLALYVSSSGLVIIVDQERLAV